MKNSDLSSLSSTMKADRLIAFPGLTALSDRGFLCLSINKNTRKLDMAWKTPKIIEVALGGEINCYACAGVK